MLRSLAQRRAVLATAAAAVALTQTPKDKLPIYPEPERDILLLETPSALEQQIGHARRAVTATYLDARAQVQGVVSRWISIEESVEHRIKSLIAPDEPLTPGLLYVGVATLTGSVLARTRTRALRLALPPALLLLSLHHFLPQTSANLAAYAGALEDAYLPALAAKHDIAVAHSAMAWARAADAAKDARARAAAGVHAAVVRLEHASGLKLRDTLGWGRGAAGSVEDGAREAARGAAKLLGRVEERVEEARHGVAEKAHESAGAVESKAEEAAAVVEKQAVEPPKRLV